ncbi:hypothetical protein [Sporomusa carbonis]|uniref:hypothetical protein n=1 Tax=Sporomusa carbonis TaxID=3076075 RepID=UPI003C7E6888
MFCPKWFWEAIILRQTASNSLSSTWRGKGLIGLARQGYSKKDDNVLFLHTGGVPSLYANTALFVS